MDVRAGRNRMKEIPLRLAYKLLTYVADVLEDVFWSPQPWKPFPCSDNICKIHEYDDGEIVDMHFNAMAAGQGLSESVNSFGGLIISKIADGVIVKRSSGRNFHEVFQTPHEALALEIVRAQTSIPVPRVFRTIQTDLVPGYIFYAMEFVDGQQLGEVWPTLSIWGKMRVSWTLRSYVRQLRRIGSALSSVPGPLGDKPQLCDGYIFESRYAGPFSDITSLSKWFRERVGVNRAIARRLPSKYDPFKDCKRMVFTHLDLNMRNILVGKDGRVWIVDWDGSGFYPEWFEYMSMSFAEQEGPTSWQLCIPFIADPYIECLRWYQLQE